MRNGNRQLAAASDRTSIPQPNNFVPGTTIYMDSNGIWQKAKSNALATLATHFVFQASATDFLLARDGDVIRGVVSGGTPGQLTHASPTVAGEIALSNVGTAAIPGAVAANVLGYLISNTDLVVRTETAFIP